MKFPLSRIDTTSAAYTHKLLLALTKALMKSCGGITITQAEMDAIEDGDMLIITSAPGQVNIRHGSAQAEVFLITAPKEEQKWMTSELPAKGPAQIMQGQTPQPQHQIPQQPLIPSSPALHPRREITPLPATPMQPKDNLDALGRPKLIPQPIAYETDADSEENLRTESEMGPESEEELQAIEDTMAEIYREPDPTLPTSPVEEIRESQEADQTVLPPSRLSNRRVVLGDMELFLREQAMNAKSTQRRESSEMILRNREGLLPFKARKDNPKPRPRH